MQYFICIGLMIAGWLIFSWWGAFIGLLVYLAHCDIKEEIKNIRRVD